MVVMVVMVEINRRDQRRILAEPIGRLLSMAFLASRDGGGEFRHLAAADEGRRP